MTFAPFNSHTNKIFIDLKMLKVREIIKLNQLKLVYDFHESRLPEDLMSLFRLSRDVHITSLVLTSVSNNLLYIPTIKTTTYGNQSIRYHCAKLWNEIFKKGSIQVDADSKKNINLSNVKSVHHLKSVLKRHFLYGYSL